MSETHSLLAVLDSSGSMRELGKLLAARNLLAYVRQRLRSGHGGGRIDELRLVVWGSETTLRELPDDVDLPECEAAGEATAAPLFEILRGAAAANSRRRMLLFSDGHLAKAELARLLAWRREAPQFSLRAVAVGADANHAALVKLAGPRGVFLPEDIVSALDPWPLEEPVPLPGRLPDPRAAAAPWFESEDPDEQGR
jgi:hypothetical protein